MRTLSAKNVYSIAARKFPFTGIWAEVFDCPERGGAWIIYGAEKNGKTSFALMLANYLSSLEKVLYISAEEGMQDSFKRAMFRAGISPENRTLKFTDYLPIEDLKERLTKRKSERIIFLDNITVYKDELKDRVLWNLIKEHPTTTFIFLAHEEKGEPYSATAKACRRYAKIIVRVEGLVAFVSGRVNGRGGHIVIDPEKAALRFGDRINEERSIQNEA